MFQRFYWSLFYGITSKPGGNHCVIVLNSSFNCSIGGWDLWADVISSRNAIHIHLRYYFRVVGPWECTIYKFNQLAIHWNALSGYKVTFYLFVIIICFNCDYQLISLSRFRIIIHDYDFLDIFYVSDYGTSWHYKWTILEWKVLELHETERHPQRGHAFKRFTSVFKLVLH